MSLRDQVNAFARRGAARRQGIYGTPFTYKGVPCIGSFSAISSERELQVGGWNQSITSTVRIVRSAYPAFSPDLGEIITLTETGQRHEISQVKNNPRAPEWVIGLINPQEA